MSSRIIEAAMLLEQEAQELEHQVNLRYPSAVTEGRITPLFGLSARVALLRHIAQQVRNV